MCARRRNSIERKAPQRARECAHRNHTQRGGKDVASALLHFAISVYSIRQSFPFLLLRS